MTQQRYAPVGVFDSGIGGLSVLDDIRHVLPEETLIYVGDSAYAPYGERSPQQIIDRSMRIAGFLIEQGAKAIVIACNTATAEAAALLRESFDIPVVGMEPAVKPAAQLSKSGVIGVLATQRTINSERLLGLTQRFAVDKTVLTMACPGLVEIVEHGESDSPESEILLRRYIEPLLDQGMDALILGCTHYPFLLPAIRRITGDKIDILETGMPVARQLQRILKQNNLLNDLPHPVSTQRIILYNTSNHKRHFETMQTLWQGLTDQHLKIDALEL